MTRRPSIVGALLLGALACSHKGGGPKARSTSFPPVVATATVDHAQITTDDPLKFTVEISRDSDAIVTTPDIGSLIKGFRIVDFGGEEKDEDGHKVLRKWFSLRADVTGSYILPEVELHYTKSGKEDTVKTSEIFVEVKAPNEASGDKAEDIRDIKGLEFTPFNYWPPLIIGLVLGTILLVWTYLKKRKKDSGSILVRPPHEVALERLSHLEIPTGHDSIALKKFYFGISEIIRWYVEERYGMRATDMTSEEIAKSLRSHSALPDSEKSDFLEILKETDLVKFTDFFPTNEASGAAKERAVSFIIRNKPVAQPETQPGVQPVATTGSQRLARPEAQMDSEDVV